MRRDPINSSFPTAAIALMIFGPVLLAFTASSEVPPEDLTSGIGRFSSIICEDVDDDGRMEILFGSYDGYVVSVEYAGGEYFTDWKSEKLGTRVWGLLSGQFDSDDTPEIIIGDGDGIVRSYDGRTKELEWQSETLVRDAHGLLLHDVDNDGDNELLVGTGFKTDQNWGTVYFFNGTSEKPYDKLPPFDSRLRELHVADLDNDGEEELLVCSGVSLGDIPGEGYFRVFDLKTRELEYKSPDLEGCVEGMKVVDLDGDGTLEIIISNGYRYRQGWCYIYHFENGEYVEVWRSPNLGPKAYGLDYGDVDGDGVIEIIVSNMAGYIFVYNGITHQLEWKSGNLGRDILGVVVADPDKDGQLEIIAGQGGYNGKGDFTSGYTTPHVYVIDGNTHEIEAVFGEVDQVVQWLKIAILIFIVIGIALLATLARMIMKIRMDARK
ncbi:MAG: FG-GAP-like repeat-containing protein [Thermoplasmatota archaeon]